jgi:hypothetical protein
MRPKGPKRKRNLTAGGAEVLRLKLAEEIELYEFVKQRLKQERKRK